MYVNYTPKKFALQYTSLGWHIFPCNPGQKTPAVKWGERSTTDPAIIELWWNKNPKYNIAVDCGKSNLYVIDCDGPEGIDEWNTIKWAGQINTLEQHTGGGGLQAFFSNPQALRNTVKILGPHIDTRGVGGYVVLPPSLHPNGNRYSWVNFARAAILPPLPDWLIPPKTHQEPIANTNSSSYLDSTNIPDGDHWLQRALERVHDGNRNHTGFWLSCMLRDDGLSVSAAAPIMGKYQKMVQDMGDHPYTWKECLASLKAAYQGRHREPARRIYANIEY